MKSQNNILITKASGETEPFSDAKLRRSLERVNAMPEIIEQILGDIRKTLKPGVSTSQIYRRAFELLRKQTHPVAARYSLKQAIMALGPTGYPFEQLVGELLKADGFEIEVSKTVWGLCVSHEIDVIAQKNDRHIMVECKFHNQSGIKSNVKISLYVQARFEDVERAWKKNAGHTEKFHEAWLITNTKLTSDAIRYAECVGIKAIGWNYPQNDSLEMRISRSGLHPVTCLTTLTDEQKRELIVNNIVLCKQLSKENLKSMGLKEGLIAAVFDEIDKLCLYSGYTAVLDKQV